MYAPKGTRLGIGWTPYNTGLQLSSIGTGSQICFPARQGYVSFGNTFLIEKIYLKFNLDLKVCTILTRYGKLKI